MTSKSVNILILLFSLLLICVDNSVAQIGDDYVPIRIEGVLNRTCEGSGTFNSTKTKITMSYFIVTPYFGGTDYDQCTAFYTH